MCIRVQLREIPPQAVQNPSTGWPDASSRPVVRCRRASGLEKTLTRGSRLRRPAVSALTLSVLLSIIAAPPVDAQDAPIFSWEGTVEVSTTTLEVPEGGAASYSLRLSQQPTSSKTCGGGETCGWWVLLRVDDADDTVSWTPSVGWEFEPQGTGPTSWRGVSISAAEDDDTDDEVIVFRHEVRDESSECPDFLHPDNLPVVRVRIVDNDRPENQPRLSILDTSVVEGDTAQFNVSLTSESRQPVTVSWATADGTAKEGTDYEASMGTVTFPARTTVQTISVPTVEDDFHEPAERFRVTLSGATGATLADASGEATIADDDEPELSIGNASPVPEGGTARFVVTLTPRSHTGTVTVAYRTQSGTATEGMDYPAKSDTLTFTAGQTTKTISVPTTDDAVQGESDERFTVVLSSPVGATINDNTGEGTITDNDGGPSMPELSIGDASVTEGGTARFEVRLTGATSGQTATVSYATADGTARVADGDYMMRSGMLTLTAEQPTMTIEVETLDDEDQESTERFTVTLSNASSGVTINDATGEGTILDDDGDGDGGGNRGNGGGSGSGGSGGSGGNGGNGASGGGDDTPLPELSIADAAVDEGEQAGFVVSLSEDSDEAVTVDYATADGTAAAGADYVAASGVLRFEPGETERTIAVPTLDDHTVEETETFTVELGAPSGATLADETATGTITDDDEPPTLSVDDPAAAVREGETAAFTVRLSAASAVAVSASYATVDGTAAAGSDYTQTSGVLRFEPGETEQTIAVATLDDGEPESEEAFTVELSAPSGATLVDGTATGTIIDNDALPTLSIDDAATVSEGETAAFTVRLSAASGVAVEVSYATADGTAAAGADYTAVSGVLRFEPGETARTIAVATLDDGEPESEETFTMELSAPSGATLADGTATGTITDNDALPTLSIDDAAAVSEGETAAFTVRLSAASGVAVEVSYATADGTAAAGADYTAVSGVLRFEPGETARTIAVATLDDGEPESEETFTMELSAPSGATLADGTATGTITDNDALPTLSIDDAAAVSEGAAAEFIVRLSVPGTSEVAVSYRTVDGTAVAGLDYLTEDGTLRFEPGETIRRVAVTTLADDLLEGAEEFTVELSLPSGATITDASGTGTITDDAARRIGLVNRVVLPEVGRALAFSAVRCRIDQVLAGTAPTSGSLVPTPRLSLSSEQRQGRRREDGAGLRQPTLEQAFDNSLLLMQSQEEEDGGGRFAAWWCADYRNLGGGGPGSVNWDGDVSSWHVGADARVAPGLLAGVSVSRSRGAFDYRGAGASPDAAGGAYELGLASIHPYLAWSVLPDLDVWGTAGHAWGRLQIVDEQTGAFLTSPATLDSGMLGVSGRLLTRGATTWRLRGEWALAQMDVARAGTAFEAATMNMRRLRLGTEVSHERVYASGVSLTPWGELGLRHDGGDGETGAGLELGGGLRYLDREAGLTVEGHGRWLTVHRGTLREWGFGALVRFAPGTRGRGPSVSLMPSWGETASGVQRLWDRGATDPLLHDAPGARLEAQFGYGFTPFSSAGVLTPYGGVSLAREVARGYRLGGRLAVGRAATVSLEAERRERLAAARVHALMLLGTVQF